MEHKKFGALSSSADPEKLSQTVRGGILAVSSLILLGAKYLDLPITETEIVTFATQAGLAVSSIWILYGIVQKIVLGVYAKLS